MDDKKTTCPKCGGHIAFPKELAGKETPCPHCNETIPLPKPRIPAFGIIAAVLALITLCLAVVLIWEHLPKHTSKAENSTPVQTIQAATETNPTDLLVEAAASDNPEVVKLLLNKGADVNVKDSVGGYTALGFAGDVEVIRLLLEKGADINAKDNQNGTALMKVATDGKTEAVRLLLDNGAEINAKDNLGLTALIWAADKGFLETVKLLLAKGADFNVKDMLDQTALAVAKENGHTDVAQLLEQAGAKE